jgi:hypothetical protein
MSLLDTASLVVTPNGTKAGKLYSVVPSSGAGDLDVTRATTATRVNSSGLIESVASNVPRLDYSNGTCPSILVEPQRTNLATYSEQFDNVVWGKFLTTITPNTITSPSGIQNADTFESSSNSSGVLFINSFVTSGDKTFSIYAKKGNNDIIDIGFTDITDFSAKFNLTSGTLVSQTSGLTSTITSVGNEWYRLTISKNITTLSNLFIINSTSLINKTIYLWGAQLEAGSYATSYIPTTSASVTRNADVISKTGISSLIGQTEGTMFLDFYYNGESKDFVPLNLYDNAGSNHISIYIEPSKVMYFNWSGSSGGILYSTTLTKGRYKVAGGYINNNFVMYVNGNLIGTDSAGIVPTCNMINLSNFGNSGVSFKEQVEINTVALWKTRLTNIQLAQLTTI